MLQSFGSMPQIYRKIWIITCVDHTLKHESFTGDGVWPHVKGEWTTLNHQMPQKKLHTEHWSSIGDVVRHVVVVVQRAGRPHWELPSGQQLRRTGIMWMKKLWNTFLWLRHSLNTASHKICWGIKHFWQNMPVLSKLGKNWQTNQNLTWIMATWVRLCWGGSRRSLELKKTCLQFVICEDQQLVV